MEENKKGQNTLYAVIGVATLVVAIIGATFAYFSAQATAGGNAITGGTNDVGASLSLNVERVLFGETAEEGATYENLVPAILEVSNTGIEYAVNNKCVANGYTGCHLYKITASSDQKLDAADILLQSFTTQGVKDIDAWKFVVFTGSEVTTGEETDESPNSITYTVSNLVTGDTAQDFENSTARLNNDSEGTVKGYNIHKDGDGSALGMDANDPETNDHQYVYYLLVYLENIENVQNPEDKEAELSATGTYSGSVVLNAAGGKVVANFSATTPIVEP